MDTDLSRDARFRLVRQAHEGQVDKCGFDYFSVHLVPVAQAVPSNLYFAALAHDVLEDTGQTVADLKGAGFSAREIGLIELLTKPANKEDDYGAYIDRIAANRDAKIIKVMDIASNLSRMPCIDDQETSRRLIAKYLDALSHLMKRS